MRAVVACVRGLCVASEIGLGVVDRKAEGCVSDCTARSKCSAKEGPAPTLASKAWTLEAILSVLMPAASWIDGAVISSFPAREEHMPDQTSRSLTVRLSNDKQVKRSESFTRMVEPGLNLGVAPRK